MEQFLASVGRQRHEAMVIEATVSGTANSSAFGGQRSAAAASEGDAAEEVGGLNDEEADGRDDKGAVGPQVRIKMHEISSSMYRTGVI